MAWTLEEIQAKRKEVEAEKAAMRTASAGAKKSAEGSGIALSVTSGDTSPKGRGKTEAGTQSASRAGSGWSSGWSAEKIRQMRAEVSAEKAAMGILPQSPAATAPSGREPFISADTVGKNVLDNWQAASSLTASVPLTRAQSGALPKGEPSVEEGMLTAQRGTTLNGARQMLESTRTKRKTDPYSELAQKVGESLSARREEEQFDKLNAWMESDEGNRELVRKLRTGKVTPYAEQSRAMQPVSVSGAAGERHALSAAQSASGGVAGSSPEGRAESSGKNAYSDAELMAMGYTGDQIVAAKQYITEFDALPAWKRAAQRASDSAEGVVSTVASAIPLTGEYLGQSILNTMGTQENLQTLWQGMEGDNRERALYAYLRGTDADGNLYTDEAIQSMGYTPDEIAAMRAKIEGTYVTDGVAPEESLGYQLAQHGQGMTELAQRGLSDRGKFWLGAATSAGENLAIAAVNPYAVMPVLTAQTVADSLFESTQSGEDAGKALARAAAKGGVGWGIEQFGVEQMLEQMGAQGTVSKIAKQLLEKLEDNQLAQSAPHLYQLVSSAGEEALEEFTETYADALVDAVIDGDAESWKKLASSETLAEAAQSALGGAAGGLLISAGAQGMGAFSRKGEASAHTEEGVHAEDSMPSQLQALSAAQSADGGVAGSSPEGRAKNQGSTKGEPSVEEVTLAGNEKAPADMQTVQEETAINDDPATHTPAQNASIEEYKDSVDVKLAEYVDRVRAGEDLEPYVVSETSDRMRNAMMELTSLDKVGDYTLMDANAVKHITNRHAGGDGSADGTMKSSADVARAAYVLNNFDNAYLATDKAEGYFDSRGKRAPIVIFEKKIDGSHIVVEAVTDTKKSRNYIVSEYLSKNGVDNEKVAKPLWSPVNAVTDPGDNARNVATANFATSIEKALRPPMDAVADPRDTSGTLNAVTSAGEPRRTIADPAEGGNRGLPGSSLSAETKTTVQESTGSSSAQNPTPSVTPGGEGVKGESYADLALKADAQSLNTESWNRAEQMDAARQLVRDARMSSAGVQTVVNNMPQGVGAAIYAPAAASLYRLGVVEDVASFDEALRLTGKGGVSGRVQQVLALGETGRKALQIAFLQGKGEAEQYRAAKAAELGTRPGAEALHEDAGTFTRNGHLSSGKNARDALIELTAKGTGVAAEQKAQLRGNAKGEIQSAIGKVFYRGDADAATVLHETLHEVNSWSNETGQELIDTFHSYLVKQNGMDSVQDLVQGYIDRYERAGQRLSYNQAMEEVTADAMQTIFGTEESFRNFVRLQAAEAKMNAAAQQRTHTVMQKIDTLLKKVLTDIKSFLGLEPDNAAAKAAKTLTEQQLRDLQDLYFAHQIEAGANYRAALEEAGGMKKAADVQDTAESRFQLHEGKDSLSGQMNDHLDELAEMETVVQVKENTMSFGRSRNENIQSITEYFNSIGNKVTRSGFGVVELGKKGARTTVQHGNSAAKQAAVASIPAVIEKGKQIGYEHNWQGRGYDTYVFAAPVEIDGVKVYEGVIVNTYEHDGRKAFYVHEVCWTDGSYVKFGDDGKLTKKEDTSTQLPKAVLSPLTETQDVSSEKSIAQSQTENKHRYQLDVDEADVAAESRYQIAPDYAEEVEEWDKAGKPAGEVFVLGSTGDTLQGLGARENDIYMNGDKIKLILEKHPEMTMEEIKRIPEILDDPVMVLASQNKGRASAQNTRLVLFGSVKAQDGFPMLCVLDLQPVENKLMINDMQKVSSAYTKDANPVEFVRGSEVLYISENKKRTTALLRSLGFQMPSELQHGGSEKTTVLLRSPDFQMSGELQRSGFMGSITYYQRGVKVEGVKFTELEAQGRYQLDVDEADVAAAREKAVGDGAAQTETVKAVMEMAQAAKVSEENLGTLAKKLVKSTDSRADVKTITNRLAALNNYLASGEVDWAVAHSIVLDVAEQVMERSAKRNDALWKQYPDLHKMSMQIQKGSSDYEEILYKYGSWKDATRELARHGVKLTLTKDGAASRWGADFAELQKIGEGFFPSEVPSSAADALEAMAAAHDAIRPTMESAYDTDWDAAKQEIAMQIWGDYLGMPGIANAANAKARGEFAKQVEQLNQQAKEHTIELTMKAKLAAENARAAQRATERADKAEAALRRAGARAERAEGAQQRAEDRAAKQKEFAKKQREAVTERVELEKLKGKERLQKARDARENDNTRRAIRKMTTELNKMFEHPSEKQYVPEYLIDKVRPVLEFANEASGNWKAAQRIADNAKARSMQSMESTLYGLRKGIQQQVDQADRASVEWENSGIREAIDEWVEGVDDARKEEVKQLRGLIEEAEFQLEMDNPDNRAYLARLREKLYTLEHGGMTRLTGEQLRGLRDILERTMFIVKNENKLLGEMEETVIDDFAEETAKELKSVKGIRYKGGLAGKLTNALSSYRLNTMNIEQNFERMGGYTSGGQMEQLGRMLNDGQYRKNKIIAELTDLFADVTGVEHEQEAYHFTHDLVDIGLRTQDGRTWYVNHDLMVELWLQMQNDKGLYHIVHGGLTIDNMALAVKGDTKAARQQAETVLVGQLDADADADTVRRELIAEIEKHLNDFDNRVIADYKKMNRKTQAYTNETSLILSGVKKALTKNYIHINVDHNTNVENNTGVRYDNSATNQSRLKERVNSGKPIVLVGMVQQIQEGISETAQYAGMAIPLRNVEKVLNSMQDGKTLYYQLERAWGSEGRDYVNKAIADLCGNNQSREVGDRTFAKLRSMAAQAVLSANVNVTLLQAASLPTAAAELGWGATGKAAVQFAKNADPLGNVLDMFGVKQSSWEKVKAEIYEHGDPLLKLRLRGTSRNELGNMKQLGGWRNSDNKALRSVGKAVDAVADIGTGSIGKMDELTVVALWEGAKAYVEAHPAEFAAEAANVGSEAYWEAVNRKYQRVIERTQPNYSTMQRTGYQRTKNEMVKTMMMFSTQRQQNAQIWVSSVENLAAQMQRYKGNDSSEAKQAKTDAVKRFGNAASSQFVQTAVIAGMGIGVKFLLHKFEDLRDENGDMTWQSLLENFVYSFFSSTVSNFSFGSEIWTAGEVILTGSRYDTISMTGIGAINDVTESIMKLYKLLDKDTDEMSEAEFAQYETNVKWAWADIAGQLGTLKGLPYANMKKNVNAVLEWMDTIHEWGETGTWNLNGAPASAAGQYDRLYDAYLDGDADEAQAALGKLELLGKTDKVYSELKKRLRENEVIIEAARKTNSGDWEGRVDIINEETDALKKLLGDNSSKVRDAVVGAVNAVANQMLIDERGGGKDATVYTAMLDELESGSTKSVQKEIDRLLKAGKTLTNVKSKITAVMKPEYAVGSDYDRKQIEELLTALTDASGNGLYTEKTIQKWGEESEEEEKEDRYDLLK